MEYTEYVQRWHAKELYNIITDNRSLFKDKSRAIAASSIKEFFP